MNVEVYGVPGSESSDEVDSQLGEHSAANYPENIAVSVHESQVEAPYTSSSLSVCLLRSCGHRWVVHAVAGTVESISTLPSRTDKRQAGHADRIRPTVDLRPAGVLCKAQTEFCHSDDFVFVRLFSGFRECPFPENAFRSRM
jgi:hypothetical protein